MSHDVRPVSGGTDLRPMPTVGPGRPLLSATALEVRVEAWAAARGGMAAWSYEFVRFGALQAWACLYGGTLLAAIAATRLLYPAHVFPSRYDALVVACVAIQATLLACGLETLAEAGVILAFHAVGTGMELFKTSVGSWSYPEPSVLRIGGVPLFSGFMYAAVGSYVARAWRILDFRFTGHPGLAAMAALSACAYANFFADHWGVDLRWWLVGAAVLLLGRTTVWFRVWRSHRRMPLLLGLALVATFVWFGENLATAAGAWLYPSQVHGWRPVGAGKLTSWFLLMLVSYSLVAGIEGSARVRRTP